jgi:antitoxin (DNA-binding transcriptional repressor) of toxin-antitoxin stability system
MQERYESSRVGELSIKCSEMVSISKFCKFPSRFINQVQDSGERIVLIKNGDPVATIISLDMLAAFESDDRQEER